MIVVITAPDSFEMGIVSEGLRSSRRELVELEERHVSQADFIANTLSATVGQIQANYTIRS